MKVLNKFTLNFDFFGLFFHFFTKLTSSFVKERQALLSKSKSVKVTETVIDF